MEGMLSSLPLGGWDGMLEHAGSRTHPSSDPQTWCFTVFTEKKTSSFESTLEVPVTSGFPALLLVDEVAVAAGVATGN